jgi:hypothetical protein
MKIIGRKADPPKALHLKAGHGSALRAFRDAIVIATVHNLAEENSICSRSRAADARMLPLRNRRPVQQYIV